MNLRQFHQYLTGFERSERFTGTGGVPDVAVFRAVFYALNDGFGGVKLIRPKYHQNFAGFIQHDVFGYHLAHVARLQEVFGESLQLGDWFVVFICPIEGLLERLFVFAIVCEILGVYPVANHEELDKLEQPIRGIERVALIAPDLLESLFHFQPPAL